MAWATNAVCAGKRTPEFHLYFPISSLFNATVLQVKKATSMGCFVLRYWYTYFDRSSA